VSEKFHRDLLIAVTNCRHVIDDSKVVFYCDPKAPGHNALNQLMTRIESALSIQQEADAKDAALFRKLVSESNPVDTIYFDNGWIIDVGGRFSTDLRKAVEAFDKDAAEAHEP
jgi:hypothetical protein